MTGGSMHEHRRFVAKRWAVVLVAIVCLMMILVVSYGALISTTPDVSYLRSELPVETSFMRHRTEQGALVRSWAWVDLEEVSPILLCAIVKSEDRGYFRHNGFEWPQIGKAIRQQILRTKDPIGGSTITQQLARNLFLTPERSVYRKLREAGITMQLEEELTKARILELYVNLIEFGNGIWGVESASQHYFDKSASALNAFEAAFLSSVIAAPTHPMKGRNRLRSERVLRRVLVQLYTSGLLAEYEWRDAWSAADRFYLSMDLGKSVSIARSDPMDVVAPARIAHLTNAAVVSPAVMLSDECGLNRELLERP